MFKQATYHLSDRSSYLERSVMRNLLSLAVDPAIISLAGGLPANELLPLEQIRECINHVLDVDGAKALQYSPQYTPLKVWIADYMQQRGVDCTPENVFITNGNQQGLHILSQLFLDINDVAVTEESVFTGIQQATKGAGCIVRTVPTDLENGVDVDALEYAFMQNPRPRLAVLIPDFHNPLGVSMSLDKRRRVAELANAYGVPLVEDDPYSMLRFAGETLPLIKSFDTDDFVFYLGSFSKMLSPAMRLGWMIIPTELMPKITVLRESVDLESSGLIQRAVAEFLQRGYLQPHLDRLNQANQHRCAALMSALNTHLGDMATWTEPQGGLFTWVTLPAGIDTWQLLEKAIKNQVIYIPGEAFTVHGGQKNTMRLNFSNVRAEAFDEALHRLAGVIRKYS